MGYAVTDVIIHNKNTIQGKCTVKNNDISIEILRGHINAGLDVLATIENYLDSFLENEYEEMGRTPVTAVVVADALSRYYTAIETLFLRISQHFENSIEHDKWHSQLLERMKLTIPNIRPPAIKEETYSALRELLRFRHFSRYYVELDYDWERLDFLLRKYRYIKKALKDDITCFDEKLKTIR